LIVCPPCLSRGVESYCWQTAVSGETESPMCRTLLKKTVRTSIHQIGNRASDLHPAPLADPPPSPPGPPARLEPTSLQIPIPANTTMISTKGWTLNSLINKSINFHRVPRVSVLSDSLSQCIKDYETSGVPLVIEGCHKHPKWSTEEFTLDSFASASSNG
jgi:hypothetical protein